MLTVMKSAHKKSKLSGYRSFPDLVQAYEDAVENLRGNESREGVRHVDGNDLGISHPVEYLYAHLVMLPRDERIALVREMRRSYLAWIEQRERGSTAQTTKPIFQATIPSCEQTDRQDVPVDGPGKPRRRS